MRHQITRRLEFDAGHRLFNHESKCAHVHGHRYVAEVTVSAPRLDSVGRVIDFGLVKELIGEWIDRSWDHAFIVDRTDPFEAWLEANRQKHYVLDRPPSAENMAAELFDAAVSLLRANADLRVERVRLYETPNCWADSFGEPR